MSQLTPCPQCQRHVRKAESRCPFCAGALSLAHVPAPVLPSKRLGRAATFAFGASVVGATALVGCGDDTVAPPYGTPPSHAGAGGSFGGSAVYGAPPSGGTGGGTNNDLAGAAAVYGAPAGGGTSDDEDVGGAGGAAHSAAGGAGGADSVDGGASGAGIASYGGPPSGAGGV